MRFLANFSNGTIISEKSDLVTWSHSEGAYLVQNNVRSRAGGCYFLIDFVDNLEKGSPKLNRPTRALHKNLKNTAASVDACETSSYFENGQAKTVERRTLIKWTILSHLLFHN